MATTFAVLVGYYAAVVTYRLGMDPDSHAIPVVTSSLDLPRGGVAYPGDRGDRDHLTAIRRTKT